MYSVGVRTRFAYLFPFHGINSPSLRSSNEQFRAGPRQETGDKIEEDWFLFSHRVLPSISFLSLRSFTALDFSAWTHHMMETHRQRIDKEIHRGEGRKNREIIEARARRNDSSTHSYSTVVTSCSCEVWRRHTVSLPRRRLSSRRCFLPDYIDRFQRHVTGRRTNTSLTRENTESKYGIEMNANRYGKRIVLARCANSRANCRGSPGLENVESRGRLRASINVTS